MEQIGVRSKRIMWTFIALYVLVIILRPIQGFPTINASLFIPMAVAIGWAQSVKERIIDRTNRMLLIGISHMLVLLHMLQLAKYDFFSHIDIARRYLWYGYYVPLLVIPLLSLFVSMRLTHPGRKGFGARYIIPLIVCITLVVFTMTNDIHGLMFKFAPGFVNWDSDYKRGIIFIADNIWIYGMMLLSLVNAVRGCVLSVAKKRAWIPFISLIAGFLLVVVFFVEDSGATRAVFGYSFLTFPFVYNVMFIMFWESVIKIGLIPSNVEYGALFNLSSINAQITDMDGKPVLKSAGAMELTEELKDSIPPLALTIDNNTKICCSKVGGGKLYWEENVAAIRQINIELARVVDALKGENTLLSQEMKLKQDKANVDIANRVYDEIAGQLKPYLVRIRSMLNNAPDMNEVDFKKALAEATIYGAYVKRKANLILIARDRETLNLKDLRLAVAESLEYAKGLRISSDVQLTAQGEAPVEAVIEAYDRFEACLENRLFDSTDILVIINGKMGFMRMCVTPDRNDDITCILKVRADHGKKEGDYETQ